MNTEPEFAVRQATKPVAPAAHFYLWPDYNKFSLHISVTADMRHISPKSWKAAIVFRSTIANSKRE